MGVSSDRTHRLKTKIVSQFKVAKTTVPDGGIRSFPPSTLLLQKQGNLNIPVYDHFGGVIAVDAGCVCRPIPTPVAGTSCPTYIPIAANPAKQRFA
jgi:hypothetical protein